MAANQVVHCDHFVLGHLEADDPLVAAFDAGTHLVGRQGERRGELFAHRMVVGEGVAARFGLLAQGVELLGRIEGVVGPPRIDELEGILEVDFATLALAVGGVGASDAYTLVDFDAAPLERVEDILLGSRNEALRVGVLDAEEHHAAVTAREEVVVECRADTADVQRAGGAGCEAHPNGSFHIVFQILNIRWVRTDRRPPTGVVSDGCGRKVCPAGAGGVSVAVRAVCRPGREDRVT